MTTCWVEPTPSLYSEGGAGMIQEITILVGGITATNLATVILDLVIVGKATEDTFVAYGLGIIGLIVFCWLIAKMAIAKAKYLAYAEGYNRGYKDSYQESYWRYEGSTEKIIERALSGENSL